ncbi:hypothetical protein HMPREF9233_00178 [Actinobaculum massiliense ACS-171-V-Col2]|uniref:Putative host cell surface-exposed lipoprotein Ltp-like HTH region domain-containing protein n=1 Tax=Actinobaculum massiliense ACS-171-V-Col2 TaxID=883066 RepID=K9F3N6_9ACTO|nr:hypothetical protein HMPREF9233_00178 [Actinobaculum massiliense ACS-171-V-Col2]
MRRDSTIHMLVDYGEFTEAEATEAVDSLDVDWNEVAVTAAKSYFDLFHMSRQDLYDQLTLIADGFPADQAEYAVDSAGIDYKQNALENAKVYLEAGM